MVEAVTDRSDPSLTDETFVQAWFRARADKLGVDPDALEIHAVTQMSRGVSRQTWTVSAVIATANGPVNRDFMVRRDHEAGSIIPTSLLTEYEIYRRLKGSPVPLADVLWFEQDPEWMPDGRPAYVRKRVDGDWRLPALADDTPERDSERIALSKEHLDNLALVHGVDWEARGFGEMFPVPSSPQRCALDLIDDCLARMAGFGVEPSPLLAEAVARLRSRAPLDCSRMVLCKGTNGHGEEVWSNGRIVAMSDWELATIGDPAYDLAQCQELIPEIVRDGHRIRGLPEALAYYTERTGDDVSQDRVEYYRELYGLLQFFYTQHVAWIVRAMPRAPLRFMWTATEVSFRSELRLAKPFAGDLMKEGLV